MDFWNWLSGFVEHHSPDDGRDIVNLFHHVEREATATEGPDPTEDADDEELEADYSDYEPEESDDDDDSEPDESDLSVGDEDWAGRIGGRS